MRPGLALAGKVRRAGHRAQTLLATSRPFAGCSSSFDSATSLPPRWKGVLFARPTRRSRRGGSGRCPPPPRPPRTRCPSGVCRPRAAAETLGGGGSRPAALAQLLLGWRGMGGDLKTKRGRNHSGGRADCFVPHPTAVAWLVLLLPAHPVHAPIPCAIGPSPPRPPSSVSSATSPPPRTPPCPSSLVNSSPPPRARAKDGQRHPPLRFPLTLHCSLLPPTSRPGFTRL